MRRIIPIFALIASTTVPVASADETGSAMADAARRFLAALDEPQKARATFSFDSPERFNWHWIPRERKGLPIKDLKPEQRARPGTLLRERLRHSRRSGAMGLARRGASPRPQLYPA
jgi:hypothetical protein